MNQFPQRRGGSGIPWWLIVGALGFLVFGGWKGFFGAILGVMLIPVLLFMGITVILILVSLYLSKRGIIRRGPAVPADMGYRQDPPPGGEVISTEARVVRSEDERS